MTTIETTVETVIVKNVTEPVLDRAAGHAANTPHDLSTRRPTRPTKLAMMWSFCGANYHGLQQQTHVAETIEEHMLRALLTAGAGRETDRTLHDLEWSKASRTDAGVSAARLVTAATLLYDPGMVERVNEHLPADIRLHDVVRVTRTFNGRHDASSRSYEYVLPTAALKPSPAFRCHAQAYADRAREQGCEPSPDLVIPPAEGSPEAANWKYGADDRARLQHVLDMYVGWNEFHNFCKPGLFAAGDPQARREIHSWTISEPFERAGVELIVLRVHGRSFIHSQIRKMVACAVMVCRGIAPPEFVKAALQRSVCCSTPTAPGLGLLLDQVWFDLYERKNPTHPDLRFASKDAEVKQWKEDHIYQRIGQGEAENAFVRWCRADVELVIVDDFWGIGARWLMKEKAQAGQARPAPSE